MGLINKGVSRYYFLMEADDAANFVFQTFISNGFSYHQANYMPVGLPSKVKKQ